MVFCFGLVRVRGPSAFACNQEGELEFATTHSFGPSKPSRGVRRPGV